MKLNGKPFDPNPPAPAILAAIKLLNALPADELLDTNELSKRVNLSSSHFRRLVQYAKQEMAPYNTNHGVRQFWGSKAAIAELKRRIGAKT